MYICMQTSNKVYSSVLNIMPAGVLDCCIFCLLTFCSIFTSNFEAAWIGKSRICMIVYKKLVQLLVLSNLNI